MNLKELKEIRKLELKKMSDMAIERMGPLWETIPVSIPKAPSHARQARYINERNYRYKQLAELEWLAGVSFGEIMVWEKIGFITREPGHGSSYDIVSDSLKESLGGLENLSADRVMTDHWIPAIRAYRIVLTTENGNKNVRNLDKLATRGLNELFDSDYDLDKLFADNASALEYLADYEISLEDEETFRYFAHLADKLPTQSGNKNLFKIDPELSVELESCASQFDAARKQRDKVIREAVNRGISLRLIGDIVGLSPQGVKNVVNAQYSASQ